MKTIYGCLLAGLLLFAGCKCHDESCTDYPNPMIRLSGFDSAEQSNVIVRMWDTAGFYTRLIDTFVSNTSRKGATPIAYISNVSPWLGYNVEIVFPSIPRTVRLYNFRYERQVQEVCPGWNKKQLVCENPLRTYVQEGTLMNYSDDVQGFINIVR